MKNVMNKIGTALIAAVMFLVVSVAQIVWVFGLGLFCIYLLVRDGVIPMEAVFPISVLWCSVAHDLYGARQDVAELKRAQAKETRDRKPRMPTYSKDRR